MLDRKLIKGFYRRALNEYQYLQNKQGIDEDDRDAREVRESQRQSVAQELASESEYYEEDFNEEEVEVDNGDIESAKKSNNLTLPIDQPNVIMDAFTKTFQQVKNDKSDKSRKSPSQLK